MREEFEVKKGRQWKGSLATLVIASPRECAAAALAGVAHRSSDISNPPTRATASIPNCIKLPT